MFIHVAKDFMKKLEDVDQRLSVSLDKDEIQTLGLKLRFYYNEVKHYNTLLAGLREKITDIQTRYGFAVEESEYVPGKQTAAAGQAEALESAMRRQQAAEELAVPQPQAEPSGPRPTLKMLNDWISQLEAQGRNPQEILTRAAEHYKQQVPAHAPIDFSLPEEGGEAEPDPRQQILPEIAPPPPQETPPAFPADEAAPAAAQAVPLSKSFDDFIGRISALFGNSEETAPKLIAELFRALDERRAEATFGLDLIGSGKKELPEEPGAGPVHFCWGYLAHLTGRNGLAINLLTQAVGLGAAYSQCYLVLARCCLAKNLTEKALINYNFASRIDPALSEARIGAARCHVLMGNPEKALEQIEDADFPEPMYRAEAALLRAEALLKLGRTEDAADLLSAAAAVCGAPDERARMMFHLGRIAEKAGDVLKAIEYYEAALDSSPDNLEARFNLGKLYLQHKAFPLAREQFNYVIKKHPDSEWADKARELI